MTAALIGFGEVGTLFARDLQEAGSSRIAVYDIAFERADSPQLKRATAFGGLDVCPSAAAAAGDAEIVFVAVTAGNTLAALGSLAGALGHAPFVVDVNSVSPATKQEGAALVEAQGGRYVEAAVMSAVPARGIRTPMLLGGPHAAAFAARMQPFDMALTVYAETIGKASAVKMCRSVIVKGMEALVTECLLTARRHHVERDVLQSLADMLPHPNWERQCRYFISRTLQHGRRRAEEMREVARTVADAGFEPLMSRAIAERQDRSADRAAAMTAEDLGAESLARLLDALMLVSPSPPARGGRGSG
ncbi:MAG TPA: DUF1932 domain-containing protein [Stellaceae bacterium]|nr:DUF1932 domain-containing protein [Stellaceae bacterium]